MIEFTANGLIEVTRDGAVLSRHRVEREAPQSALVATTRPSG